MSVAKASQSVVPGYSSPSKVIHEWGCVPKDQPLEWPLVHCHSLSPGFPVDLLWFSWLCPLSLGYSNPEELFSPCSPPQMPKWPGRVL